MLTQQFIHLIYENNVQMGIFLTPMGVPREFPWRDQGDFKVPWEWTWWD